MNTRPATILNDFLHKTQELRDIRTHIEDAYTVLKECFSADGKVMICGNGGSASDAEHIVGELMKSFVAPRPVTEAQALKLRARFADTGAELAARLQRALPAISLVSQTSLGTAIANDVSPELVFAQQVFGYGRAGDVLIAISTSGKSKNVLNAAMVASAFGMKSIAFTGELPSPLREICTVTIGVPGRTTAEIQEHHLKLYHVLCGMIEAELFPG